MFIVGAIGAAVAFGSWWRLEGQFGHVMAEASLPAPSTVAGTNKSDVDKTSALMHEVQRKNWIN